VSARAGRPLLSGIASERSPQTSRRGPNITRLVHDPQALCRGESGLERPLSITRQLPPPDRSNYILGTDRKTRPRCKLEHINERMSPRHLPLRLSLLPRRAPLMQNPSPHSPEPSPTGCSADRPEHPRTTDSPSKSGSSRKIPASAASACSRVRYQSSMSSESALATPYRNTRCVPGLRRRRFRIAGF
jgi:hypothetical protein